MTTLKSIKSTLKALNSLEYPYMITGAYAVSYYGRPRATHDIDIVIELDTESVGEIIKTFKKEFELDEEMIKNAVAYHTHFTMIHSKSGLKAEFWLAKNKPFERSKMERRQKIKLFGIQTSMISAEDIILTKLEWFKRSKNHKHVEDAVGIAEVQGGTLDYKYISKWSKELGIEDYIKHLESNY